MKPQLLNYGMRGGMVETNSQREIFQEASERTHRVNRDMWCMYGVPIAWHSETVIDVLHRAGFSQIALQRKKRSTRKSAEIRVVATTPTHRNWVMIQVPTHEGGFFEIDVVKENERQEEITVLEIMDQAEATEGEPVWEW